MALARGPFNFRWGINLLTDIEEVSTEFEQDSEDYSTLQGNVYELDGPMKVALTATFLSTDIPTLAVLLPQYYVANGETLSTGETVTDAVGAIDVRPAACDEELVMEDLDIESCADPSNILRLKNMRTKIDSVELDNKVRKVIIRFVGEASSGQAVMQFFREGGINPQS